MDPDVLLSNPSPAETQIFIKHLLGQGGHFQ